MSIQKLESKKKLGFSRADVNFTIHFVVLAGVFLPEQWPPTGSRACQQCQKDQRSEPSIHYLIYVESLEWQEGREKSFEKHLETWQG